MVPATDAGHDYAELRSRLTTAMRRVCPPWLADQSDDLVQMSLMRILRGYADAQLNTSFLHRVAHSVVIDEIRRRKRRNEVGITPSLPERIRSDTPSPEGVARGTEIGDAILECLAALLQDRRRAVTLHLQGHSVPEVAELLGFDRKQAENHVYRGLKDLRAALVERGLQP
ncbi:MAG: RNA polymerase sigma factor [Myxococcales bacterium]|nr:RNA polymerase sigma factor [Myxococcales bacterium]